MINALVVNTVPTDPNGVAQVIFNISDNINHDYVKYDLVSINIPEQSYYDRIERYGGHIYVLDRRIANLLCYTLSLYKLIKTNKYDIIHIHGNSALLIIEVLTALLANCRVRITHSHNTRSNYPFIHKLLRPLYNLCLSGRLACGYEAGMWMYGRKPFTVINNGINTEKFRFNNDLRKNLRKDLGLSEEDILVGHVGFFNDQKNHIFLLDCFQFIQRGNPHYKLILLGDGPNRTLIETKIREHDLQSSVVLTGLVTNINEFLSAIDLILMPSLYEGLPLAMIEEQACGLRCYVSDTITKEVDKTGLVTFLSLSDSPQKWANLIVSDYQKKDRIEESEAAIRRIIESGYDIASEADKVLMYYNSILK